MITDSSSLSDGWRSFVIEINDSEYEVSGYDKEHENVVWITAKDGIHLEKAQKGWHSKIQQNPLDFMVELILV